VPQKESKYWLDDDIALFLLHAKDHWLFPFFVCALYTGMRKGEIASLKWDSVDWHNNFIIVKGTKDRFGDRERTKSGRIRYVPIAPFLAITLKHTFNKRSCNSPYVITNNGKPIDTNHIYRHFRQLQKKAGVSKIIRAHDLRHTYASNFMMKGMGSLFELGQILGHSDVKMTQRYAHLSRAHLMSRNNMIFGPEEELEKHVTPILPLKKFERIESGNVTHQEMG
jgi:integrase